MCQRLSVTGQVGRIRPGETSAEVPGTTARSEIVVCRPESHQAHPEWPLHPQLVLPGRLLHAFGK